jgi:hypothetical protein
MTQALYAHMNNKTIKTKNLVSILQHFASRILSVNDDIDFAEYSHSKMSTIL